LRQAGKASQEYRPQNHGKPWIH